MLNSLLKQLEELINDKSGNITLSVQMVSDICNAIKKEIPICDLGDTIYVPKKVHWECLKIVQEPCLFEYKVNEICKTENGFLYKTEQCYDFENSDFGTCAFLDKTQAEQKILEFEKEKQKNDI